MDSHKFTYECNIIKNTHFWLIMITFKDNIEGFYYHEDVLKEYTEIYEILNHCLEENVLFITAKAKVN